MHAIRASCLLQFRELAAELGGDGDAILRAAGVAPDDAGRSDRFISLRGAVEAAELAADLTGTPDFGRRLAARRGIETIGPVGVAASTADTLATAFKVFATFMGAHSPGLRVRLHPPSSDRTAFCEFAIALDPPPRQRQAIEVTLGATLQILRAILDAGYAPLAVHLPHSALTPPADYVRYFGCTPHFARPAAGFVLRSADLDRRLRHDEPVHGSAMGELRSLVVPDTPSAARAVTEVTSMLLATGALTVELVAAQLQMHPRALQRRLAAEGTSYAALVDKVRRETAERYLRDTDISLDHLTRLMGYSEQSVLTRSCRRWFGRAPTAYRRGSAAPST